MMFVEGVQMQSEVFERIEQLMESCGKKKTRS